MEQQPHSRETYSREWFRVRAFESLKELSSGEWDYSDSLLLYTPTGEKDYEKIQESDTAYYRLVTKPEKEYLGQIASSIISELPNRFQYVDLGPGTEHKEQFLFDAAKRQNKEFSYVPVDISDTFLKSSVEYASRQGISTHPLQIPFEDLPSHSITNRETPSFVSLGLTYSNYKPEMILSLLKSAVGESGIAFVNSQIRDRTDMSELQRIYSEDVSNIARSKLELVGLDIKEDISRLETDQSIRVWCTLRRSNSRLEQMGILSGMKLLLFQSLRPTLKSFESDIKNVFPSYVLFDTGGPFVGAVLKLR